MTRSEHSLSRPAFDWIVLGLTTLMIGGLMLVYWAGSHGQLENAVLTVWHVPLYVAGLAFAYVAFSGIPGQSANEVATLPPGYEHARLGVVLFAFGIAADLGWHAVVGPEEAGIAQIVSPLHMVAFGGAGLMVLGPLLAARRRLRSDSRAHSTALVGLPIGLLLVLATAALGVDPPFTAVHAAADESPPPLSQLYQSEATGDRLTRLLWSDSQSTQEPSFNQEGDRIAFSAWTLGGNDEWTSDLYLLDADGATRAITHDGAVQGGPRISPDGSRILFSRVSEATPAATAPPDPDCPGGAQLPQPGCPLTAVDTAVPGGWDVWTIGIDGAGLTQLTDDPGLDVVGDWSPDGSEIIFHSDRDGDGEIYRMRSDGADVRQLTDNAVDDWWPTWSTDGRIAFQSYLDAETAEIYTIDADGGDLTRWTTDEAEDSRPAISPLGDRMVFASDRGGSNWDLYVLDGPGSEPRNVSNTPTLDEGASHWGPDGLLAFDATPQVNVAAPEDMLLGVAGILILAVLVAAALLLGLSTRPAPGVFTVAFTIGLVAIALTADQARFIPAAVATGVLADVLTWRLQPSIVRPGRLVAVVGLVPAVLIALYVATVLVTDGTDWSVHLTLGVIVMAGLAGSALAALVAGLAGWSQEPITT